MITSFPLEIQDYQKGFWKTHVLDLSHDGRLRIATKNTHEDFCLDSDKLHQVAQIFLTQLENSKDFSTFLSLAKHFCAVCRRSKFSTEDQLLSFLFQKIKNKIEEHDGILVIDYSNKPKLMDADKFASLMANITSKQGSLNELKDVKQHIAKICHTLDPKSRYITEFMEIINKAESVTHLNKLFYTENCRGLKWAGIKVFADMSLDSKIRCNLITNETWLMRFSEKEQGYIINQLIPSLQKRCPNRPIRILSLPCSHGEEAFTFAKFCSIGKADRFLIEGYDVQEICIQKAVNNLELDFPEYKERIHFAIADVFSIEFQEMIQQAKNGQYDLIVCRNFLGYFQPEITKKIVQQLYSLALEGGYLMLDSFIIDKKHPEIFSTLAYERIPEQPLFRVHH